MGRSAEFETFLCLSCSEQLSLFTEDEPLLCPFCGSSLVAKKEYRKPIFMEDEKLLPVYIESIIDAERHANVRVQRLVAESTLVDEFYRKGTITKEQADRCRADLRMHFYGI